MKRIMTIYGTRPEAIKMAPLVKALEAADKLEPVVAVTGQHREMLDEVNALFGITPAHDLDLMRRGASLTEITTSALTATSQLIERVAPDAVVVQGDTTSAFTGALASFYNQVPVVHLEAGLRTGNIYSPFPEEVNRRLTAPLSALHLAPTPTSRANLEREGIDPTTITVTGNTVIDALLTSTSVHPAFRDPRVPQLLSAGGPILLVTTHRRESWGAPMEGTMAAVREVAERHPEVQVLLPMHRNPTVRNVVEHVLGRQGNVLLTDSGGVQEEAPSLGKPVLVLRDTTERPEAVHAGTVRLVGTGRLAVRDAILELFEDGEAWARMSHAVNPYGDGHAAPRCVAAIEELFGLGRRLPDFIPAE